MRKIFLTGYGLWYLLTADLIVIAAGTIARSPEHIVVGVVAACLAVATLVRTVRAQRRYWRSGTAPLRAELLSLLQQRAGTVKAPSVWLNRDAHLVFAAWHVTRLMIREYGVARADEDQAAMLAPGGKIALTSNTYMIIGNSPYVESSDVGAVAVTDEEGNTELQSPEKVSWVRYIIQYLKMQRTGMLYAGADELRELISQFKDAEPINPDVRDE